MRKMYTLFLRALLCMPGCLLLSRPVFAQSFTAQHIATGPNSNGFYEYLPAGYSTSSTTYPLLVFLHGVGEEGNGGSDLSKVLAHGPPQLQNQGKFPASFTVNGKTFSFICISPQFVGWPSDADVDDVIEYAKKHYRVDVNRIYLTGLSMGGIATWSYAPEEGHAEKLAAIVPIAGGPMYSGTAGAKILAANSVAIFAAANLNDPTVPSSGTIQNIQIINSVVPHINPPALDTIYNVTGHGGWDQTYNPANAMHNGLNIYQWMLQYAKNQVSTPLPVTLTYFTATLSSGTPPVVNLAWATSSESNNKFWIIQRSSDGKSFTNIDTVPAAANATNGHTYSSTDDHPLVGSNYYRLNQVDLDGKSNYSNVVEVTVQSTGGGGSGLHLSPNPLIGNTLTISLTNSYTGSIRVRLLDVQGRLLGSQSFQKQAQQWTQSINLSNLRPGTFYIQVTGTNFKATQSFVRK